MKIRRLAMVLFAAAVPLTPAPAQESAPDTGSSTAPDATRRAPGWRASARIVDDQGRPVAGATVHARLPFATAYSELARRDFEATADAAGVATILDLPAGQPIVFEVAHEPHLPTRSAIVAPRSPGGDATPPSAEIVLTEGRAARLTIHDAFGAPVEGASVRVLSLVEPRLDFRASGEQSPDQAAMRTRTTDSEGRAAFDRLPAEILTVEARAAGFEPRMIVIDARAVPVFEAAIRLDRDQNPPAATMPWFGSLPEAFAAAERAGVPILVAMTMDGERANDWMASHHFRDPEIIRIAELVPCLLASAFGEGGIQARDVPHVESDEVCSRYGAVPCSAHQAVEAWARAELLDGIPSFTVPRHIVVDADGRVLEHRAFYLSERELRRMILRAIRESGSEAGVWIAIRRLQPLWHTLCDEDDGDERRAAIAACAALVNSGDEDAITMLHEFGLEAIPPAVRMQILEALLLPALSNPVQVLRGFVRDPEPAIRLRAWQRLHGVASRVDVRTALALIDTAETDDAVMVAALRALGVDDQASVVLVADPSEGERWRIVEFLLDRTDAATLKGVDAVLDQRGTEGRNRVMRALAAVPDDDAAFRRLYAHAAAADCDAIPAIRALANAAFGTKPARRLCEVLRAQTRCESALVRQEAVTQLARLRAPDSLGLLASALADPSEPVRLAAALGLWRQDDRRGAEILAAGIDDPELGSAIRYELEIAWEKAAPKDPDAWRAWLRKQ